MFTPRHAALRLPAAGRISNRALLLHKFGAHVSFPVSPQLRALLSTRSFAKPARRLTKLLTRGLAIASIGGISLSIAAFLYVDWTTTSVTSKLMTSANSAIMPRVNQTVSPNGDEVVGYIEFSNNPRKPTVVLTGGSSEFQAFHCVFVHLVFGAYETIN